jgi:vacuolar-type H+-ATPase subunit I/STV1
MSARAMASQKAKRAGGSGNAPVEISQVAVTNNAASGSRITIQQAIYILEKKILDIEAKSKENSVQTDLMNGFANHLNILQEFKDVNETRLALLEKENSNLKLKLSQFEEFIPSIRGSIMSIENKIKNYDDKVNNIPELQKLVNTMSTRLMKDNQ